MVAGPSMPKGGEGTTARGGDNWEVEGSTNPEEDYWEGEVSQAVQTMQHRVLTYHYGDV
jgi:hypothetical protein